MKNDAAPYLHAKIVQCSRDHFSDLGFMAIEDIGRYILLDNFSHEDCKVAVHHCAREGVLNVYYRVPCPHCSADEWVREEGYQDREALTQIKNEGIVCSNCRSHISPVFPLKEAFTIPQEYLGADNSNSERSTSIIGRFLNFLYPF